MKYIIISGYFNPIHIGHLSMIRHAKGLGDKLIVIVNNDNQAIMKHGYSFMPEDERCEIVGELRDADEVYLSSDEDRTVCKTIKEIYEIDNKDGIEWIFANGGDQTAETIPETAICNKLGIKMVFGVGGEKITSSSELLKNNYYQLKKKND